PRLDERRAEERVEQALGLARADRLPELARVRARHLMTERDPAHRELRQHRLEVLQLLARELRERHQQLPPLGILEEEAHRGGGCLLLAVGVVEEDLVEVRARTLDPRPIRRGGEAQHRGLLARRRGPPKPRTLGRTSRPRTARSTWTPTESEVTTETSLEARARNRGRGEGRTEPLAPGPARYSPRLRRVVSPFSLRPAPPRAMLSMPKRATMASSAWLSAARRRWASAAKRANCSDASPTMPAADTPTSRTGSRGRCRSQSRSAASEIVFPSSVGSGSVARRVRRRSLPGPRRSASLSFSTTTRLRTRSRRRRRPTASAWPMIASRTLRSSRASAANVPSSP